MGTIQQLSTSAVKYVLIVAPVAIQKLLSKLILLFMYTVLNETLLDLTWVSSELCLVGNSWAL